MFAASSALAGQAELSIESRIGGDSNVFRSSADPTDDGILDISPRVAVRDDGEDLNYSLDYQPTYRNFFKTAGIDGVDHVAHARTGWSITPVDSIQASGSYFNGRQFLFGSSGSGAGSTVTVNDRERVRISDGQLGYRRRVTPKLSARIDGFFDDFDASGTSSQSQTDSRAYTGRVSFQYNLSPRLEVGLSSSGRVRENRAVGPYRASSRTSLWDVLASVNYVITPTVTASLQVGPSFIRQQQIPAGASDPNSPANCARFGLPCDPYDRRENTSTNLFASASLEKTWQASALSVSYLRTEARSGTSASSSSINDHVQLDGSHRFNDRLSVRTSWAWDQYEQLVNQQGTAGQFKLLVIRGAQSVEFMMSKRIYLIGQYTFVNQENNSSVAGGSSDVHFHVGFLGLRYTFEPLSY